MKLKSVHVNEYRSIANSNKFDIGDVTCLVGKNEAGKTSLLDALYRLNPIVEADAAFDVTEDYPRSRVEEYQLDVEQKKRTPAIVIKGTFLLDAAEMAPVKTAFGNAIFKTHTVSVSRGYDGGLHIELDLDEHSAVERLVEAALLPPNLAEHARGRTTLSGLSTYLTGQATEQQQTFNSAQLQANAIVDPQAKAIALGEANKPPESEGAKQLRAKLLGLLKEGLSIHVWENYLKTHFPMFLYFDEFYQMEGQLNIQKLKERQANKKLRESDHAMLALIELARLNLDQLLSPQNTQALLNKLEGASNYLSEKIFEYWSQNKNLSIRFDIRPALSGDPEGMKEGTNLWGQVHDSVHKATLRLGTRSRGFIWFFSFLAWFSQQRKSGRPLILLLDEPGLFLHASAQGDLLRYVEEELKSHHQVIYTTHSPFMVDSKHFDRVRIVRDRSMEARTHGEFLSPEDGGTKVLGDVLEADEGSIFPLQGALAYDITQTMFVGPNSLIVEGVSDMFYIDTLAGTLSRAGREGLSNKWTLSPVGGSEKVSSFIALFRNQKGLNIATLIDTQKKDEQKIENLYKSKLLKKKQVLTFADFTKTREADVEDMFDLGFYLDLVNEEYKVELTVPITEAALSARHPRILVRLETYFETVPLKTGKFNHYRPARYFATNIEQLERRISSETLARFEEAFKSLNSLIQE